MCSPWAPASTRLRLVLDGELDRLIIADLEMQEGVLFEAAPVAAVQGVVADEIDCTGDVAAIALGHHQQDAVGQPLADE